MRTVDSKFNHFLTTYSQDLNLKGFKCEEGLCFTWELEEGSSVVMNFPSGKEIHKIKANLGGWQPGFVFHKNPDSRTGGITQSIDKSIYNENLGAWEHDSDPVRIVKEGTFLVLRRKK